MDAAQRRGAVEHPRSEEREECASGRLAYAQCAQVGEDRTSHNRRTPQVTDHGLLKRAPVMLHAAMKRGETTVGLELIAHFDC